MHAVGLQQGRKTLGDAAQHAAVMFTLQFDFFPVLLYLLGILHMLTAKDMRMAYDHLLADAVEHIGDVEGAFFLSDLGIEDEVQHQVTELFFHLVKVVIKNGLAEFVGLLDGKMTQSLDGLDAVPWATCTHGIHNI